MVAPQSTDVVIVGAGIAGLSLALGLARHGMKVTIIEAGQPTRNAFFSARSCGLGL